MAIIKDAGTQTVISMTDPIFQDEESSSDGLRVDATPVRACGASPRKRLAPLSAPPQAETSGGSILTTASGRGGLDTPASAGPALPATRLQLVRPQPGNKQDYFTMLHKHAGRRHFSKPFNNHYGQGQYGRWVHRGIPALPIAKAEHNACLLDMFLANRSLSGFLTRPKNARACGDTGGWCVEKEPHAESVYYANHMAQTPRVMESPRQAYGGSYFYTLWATVTEGFEESGRAGEGGDFKQRGTYCTPLPQLAYDYAVPHQLFGNGVFFKLVYDLTVDYARMKPRGEQHRGRDNWEWCVDSRAVRINGLHVIVNTSVSQGDHRMFSWEPQLEAIPNYILEAFRSRGEDFLNAFCPREVVDSEPELPAVTPLDWIR